MTTTNIGQDVQMDRTGHVHNTIINVGKHDGIRLILSKIEIGLQIIQHKIQKRSLIL